MDYKIYINNLVEKFINEKNMDEIKNIKNNSGQTITLNRDNLPNGIYFLQMTQENKIIATEKLIITD